MDSISKQIDDFIVENSSNTGDPLTDTRDALNIALAKIQALELAYEIDEDIEN